MSRPRTRRYLDELDHVALATLRPILGRPGASAVVRWADGSEARIGVEADSLTFEHAPVGGAAPVREHVALRRRAQPYGGVQFHATCPSCGATVRVLFATQGRLRCRHCARATYRSKALSPANRHARRHFQIRARIAPGAHALPPGVVPPRPRGMRWRRYRRLERTAAAAWQRRQAIVLAQIRLALVALRASIGAPATLPAGPVLRTEEPR